MAESEPFDTGVVSNEDTEGGMFLVGTIFVAVIAFVGILTAVGVHISSDPQEITKTK